MDLLTASSLSFMSLVCFQASNIWMCFWNIYCGAILKSLSGRNKSLEAPVFGFSNSLPYDLGGNRHLKMPKIPAENFFFTFLNCHHGFTNCLEILNFVFSNIIPRKIATCKIPTF